METRKGHSKNHSEKGALTEELKLYTRKILLKTGYPNGVIEKFYSKRDNQTVNPKKFTQTGHSFRDT